nr:methylated-DNA--[protein]-cysteine S-methyltransferase [Enterococcus plantarum]
MNKNKTARLRDTHKKDKLLVFLNIWAVTIVHELTKKKVALVQTSSYAISDYYGYQDCENMPFAEILGYVKQMNPESNYIVVPVFSFRRGETSSYKGLTVVVGSPNEMRAVGNLNGANQLAIIIPCLRVIQTDGSLGDMVVV